MAQDLSAADVIHSRERAVMEPCIIALRDASFASTILSLESKQQVMHFRYLEIEMLMSRFLGHRRPVTQRLPCKWPVHSAQ